MKVIRDRAAELGIHAVGVAPAIDEVRAVFPWAGSVVCAAASYLPPDREPEDDAPRGLVARFARGADYHAVLREKLSRLSEAIQQGRPRARLEVCVDTTPIPERKLAVLAGIAWRGWNSNVFVEGRGSWVALGEIVTDLELPAGKPLSIDRCVDCGRCIRHCPTGAIVEPYVVDRTRCLSELTQRGGAIPRELRLKLGNRIYGCDTCQEVCPQNAALKPATPEFAESRFPGAHPELVPLIELSAAAFRERVSESSIGWIGRNRIRRNAAIAAGNLRRAEAIPALNGMLADPDPFLREHAAWAIERIERGGDDDA